MPMHTIPQNVTSYEDKIVGIFVGRQFIYLAVGGLTAFVLISTGGGAAVFFRFVLAIGAVAFGAALALVKVNDRGFDVWVYSFLKAVLGPTEWVWVKNVPLNKALISPDTTSHPASQFPTSADKEDEVRINYQRKEAFKHFVSGSSKDLDADERRFLQNLNFSEPIPSGGKIQLTPRRPAPPMLTPENQVRPDVRAVPVFEAITITPIAALAQPTNRPSLSFNLEGQSRSVSLLHNQRTNRSLPKDLLVGGAMPVPVRGELRLNLDPKFQQELTKLIGFAPEGGLPQPLGMMPAPPPAAPPTPPPADDLMRPQMISENVMNIKMDAASDWQRHSADSRRKLIIEPAATPHAQDTSLTPPTAPDSDPAPAANIAPVASDPTDFEALAKRAEEQLAQEKAPDAANPEVLADDTQPIAPADYQQELERVQQRSQDAAVRSQQAQQQLESLKQQVQVTADPAAQAQLEEQISLLEKLRQEEQRSAAFARELLQKMGQTSQVAPPATPTSPVPAPTNLPTLTQDANVINGFVLTPDGQFVDGAVVVIKDESGEAKRALKTNKLGQFVVTTPLANGRYVVEVDKKGMTIDTINVELKGQPILPLVAQARPT